MSLSTKIKIADLRDRIAISYISVYNDTTTGAPSATYTAGPTLWAMVRLRIISGAETNNRVGNTDKIQVEQGYEIIIRKDVYPIKPQDKIVWGTHTLYIRNIEDIDVFFTKLTCAYVY